MRVLSGIQPTGELHIGNYFGAIKQWIELQKNNECIFPIVDLHAMTVPYSPSELQKNILKTAADYLALGVDPSKCVIFIQSEVFEHTELAWILNTITPLGELERMTQFKEKSKLYQKNINAGLLTYPVLQAADILLYQTDIVPVGKDQKQHIELARTIARKFNHLFGETFKEPEALIPKFGGKIMSLNNPNKKMSKSLGEESYLAIFNSPQEIKEKIKKAVTDSGKEIKSSADKPAITNLINIYSLFSEMKIEEIEKEFKGRGYEYFKDSLIDLVLKKLKPYQRKRKELEAQPKYIKKLLRDGAKRAKIIAGETMEQVRKKVGISG
ncbi:MAG: tryptophan--tRNA ligase [Parcubacteria group bacterium CG11_big_fil_rev_8_21_14_0_20_39_14]|nr:MAG: tryptophan--tRNA ligase [Parcubacteria group bacterium CG11_big_fil_rev_8_21_14_0_20_39_14]PIS35110.1 MAG: tryptophan--tRNA ligase [Parcubacteria group bacterium CG08_land_8_20_14_0_20_38_56]